MRTLRPTFIVGIGGSAGGLNAYKAFLDALPSTTGMAFVIVSHILPSADSRLAEILSRHTKMKVMVASSAMPIRKNHVYISPPDSDLLLDGDSFKVVSPRTTRKQIDVFLTSLAEVVGTRAVGIILSGYLDDGTEGCRQIKENGGTTFAQDMSAEVHGMPLNAQASGCVDFVLPAGEIPAALQRLISTVAARKNGFDPNTFLSTIGQGRKIVRVPKNDIIYSQGDACDAVFYIQKGVVTLSVVSNDGKQATTGMMNPGDFVGECCLAGQPVRMGSANATTDCELMRIDKKAMMLALGRELSLSHVFTACLLARNIRYEADLVDRIAAPAKRD